MLFGAADFFTVGAGVFSGVMEGVTFFAGRRLAYGSAVAGRANSGRGRIGRLTVPPIKDPVPEGFDPKADFVEPPGTADGLTVLEDAVEALDAVLELSDFADCDFMGV